MLKIYFTASFACIFLFHCLIRVSLIAPAFYQSVSLASQLAQLSLHQAYYIDDQLHYFLRQHVFPDTMNFQVHHLASTVGSFL